MNKIYIGTGILAVVGGLVTAVTVSSCDTECTMEAVPSVIVQFVDQTPATSKVEYLTPSEIWYTYTDPAGATETQRPQCIDEACSEWLLGYERPGTYEVHATICGKEYVETVEVGLTEDGCHVDTEWLRIQADDSTCPGVDQAVAEDLQAAPKCTLEARFSVLASVVAEIDGELVPVKTDSRYFKWSGDADQRKWPGMCLNEDCSIFAAGTEQEGRFEIGAEVCGQVVTAMVPVEETADGCHVDTQRVTLTASVDGCDEPPKAVYPPIDPMCLDKLARPSAIVMPVTDGGDVWLPYPTEQMWYQVNGETLRARCAHELDQNGKCTRWITGYEKDGKFAAYTETCDVETKVEYRVDKDLDGCHVQTMYVPVFMDTRGCIQAPQPEGGEPRPMFDYDTPKPLPVP